MREWLAVAMALVYGALAGLAIGTAIKVGGHWQPNLTFAGAALVASAFHLGRAIKRVDR